MKVDKLVPEVYYRESRDFGFVGRLVEILLNYMKTNGDLVFANLNSENIKSILLELLNTTLGFESKHEYNVKDLVYIASSFSDILRKKGTLEVISEIVRLLLASQSIYLNYRLDESPDGFGVEPSLDDPCLVELLIPIEMQDVILLEDLLDYVLPAGVILNISTGNISKEEKTDTVNVDSDSVTVYGVKDAKLGLVYDKISNIDPTSSPADRLDKGSSVSYIGTVVSDYSTDNASQLYPKQN